LTSIARGRLDLLCAKALRRAERCYNAHNPVVIRDDRDGVPDAGTALISVSRRLLAQSGTVKVRDL